jgi:hypothetical protein
MDALKYAKKNLELVETKFRQGISSCRGSNKGTKKNFTNTWVSLINILINYHLLIAKQR